MLGKILSIPLTASNTKYTAGDQIDGVKTLEGVGNGGAHALLKSLTVVDREGQSPSLTLLFFDRAPTVTSSDNAPVDISGGDLLEQAVGIVKVDSSAYIVAGNGTIAMVTCDFMVKPQTGDTIYLLVIAQGTPTYSFAQPLRLKLAFDWG